ncbi:MAG: hypothetical protein A2042_04055, partial [Candidatus Schekmanbacteria bacterium GWA2_38_11]
MNNFFSAINYIFIIVAILVGGFIVINDLKFGKIKNNLITLGLKIGIILYLILLSVVLLNLFILNPISSANYNLNYFIDVLINMLICAIVGYSLWRYRVWAAGDAKLFFLFSFLTPLEYYSKDYLILFPSFILLVNTFIPIFILLFGLALYNFFNNIIASINGKNNHFKAYIRQEINNFIESLSKKNDFLIFAVSIISTAIILPIFRTYLFRTAEQFGYHLGTLIFLGLYFGRIKFNDYAKILFKKIKYLAILSLIIILYFIVGIYAYPLEIQYALKVAVTVGVLFRVILWCIDKIFNMSILAQAIEYVKIDSVKAGMIISDELNEKLEKKINQKNVPIENISGDGLTDDQVKFLKDWYGDKGKQIVIPIYKSIS